MATVNIVFMQDWDTESGAPEWGDWQAMAEYLAEWDMGAGSDAAFTAPESSRGSDDKVEDFTVGGLTYTMTWNTALRYAALERSPLN